MNYVLWNDNCSDCQFIANAFTFLQIPLTCTDVTNDSFSASDYPTHAVMITCKNSAAHFADTIHQTIAKNRIQFILCGAINSNKYQPNAQIQYLPMPLCKYKLIDALSYCYDYYNSDEEFIDPHNPCFEHFVGNSPTIKQIKTLIKKVASIDSTVLIQGESGTGKDVIANCIHQLSNRSKKPFVPINCGAIPSELLESELFGYEKGAFTGASTRRAGRFEMAQGGTLFLDEIGEMPFSMQVKLLRVLQERKIERIGGNCSIDIDIRIIAATNKNIEALIQEKKFREDLFYRLNVFPIQVSSLAERRDDIPLLIDYYLEKIYARIQHKIHFTQKAKKMLSEYPWPGNIRELQNFLERMVILHADNIINEHILSSFIKIQKQKKSAKFNETAVTY